MFDSQYLAFAGLAAILTLTPGADTMLTVRNVLKFGRMGGVWTAIGICFGLFVHASLSCLGLSIILARSALAFECLKLLGAAYLIYIGFKSIRAGFDRDETSPDQAGAVAKERPPSLSIPFREGFLCNVLNPKVAIFYLALLPQFISPGDNAALKSFVLAGTHFGMGLVWLTLVSIFLDKMRGVVDRPKIRKKIESLSGAVIAALGIKLACDNA